MNTAHAPGNGHWQLDHNIITVDELRKLLQLHSSEPFLTTKQAQTLQEMVDHPDAQWKDIAAALGCGTWGAKARFENAWRKHEHRVHPHRNPVNILRYLEFGRDAAELQHHHIQFFRLSDGNNLLCEDCKREAEFELAIWNTPDAEREPDATGWVCGVCAAALVLGEAGVRRVNLEKRQNEIRIVRGE